MRPRCETTREKVMLERPVWASLVVSGGFDGWGEHWLVFVKVHVW